MIQSNIGFRFSVQAVELPLNPNAYSFFENSARSILSASGWEDSLIFKTESKAIWCVQKCFWEQVKIKLSRCFGDTKVTVC